MTRQGAWTMCLGLAASGVLTAVLAVDAGQGTPLEEIWQQLADDDGATANRAIWRMALAKTDAVAFLSERVKPAAGDRQQVEQLIRNLDSNVFIVRDRASAELERLGDAAEEALKHALMANSKLETKRRIEALLARLREMESSPDGIRYERSLDALELIGDADALALLRKLASGNAAARRTRLAQESLARLSTRRRVEAPTAP